MMPAPSEVQEAAEQRCRAVRDGDLLPYGPLVRSGAFELIATMFPRFMAHRGADAVMIDIDAFFKTFGAERAAFIHLGTEFVRFMAETAPHDASSILLEFEWALFDVEISQASVPAWSDDSSPHRVRLNPTARFIATPFDVLADAVPSDDIADAHAIPHAYALFRTAQHLVRVLPLRAVDVAQLEPLHTDDRPMDAADPWLVESLARGLLVPIYA
ncbi:hypothetical protein [Xanthomonas sp. NCPPB 2632]|uniref:hypothetical protein n=1 Tax=Xanthomonas sp. NCPPB 2632 TaxID=3240912 RepID=UPI003514CAA3